MAQSLAASFLQPALLLALVALAPAQETDWAYSRTETMVPMRDGTRLYTEVHAPKEPKGPLPFLFLRTPYNAFGRGNSLTRRHYEELVAEGYLFVFQDIRGKYRSEGEFQMLRPRRGSDDPAGVDEGTDAYDTIEWLLANVPGHNGRVGMHGVSYDGWTTVQALIEPHPALRAASPQASPDDMWLGDDFFHNGAFRLSYGFEYSYALDGGREWQSFPFDRADTFEWFLDLGPLSNVNEKHFQGRIDTWNQYVEHHTYDEFWKARRASAPLNAVTVPTLHVAGFWDQEDLYGPLSLYQAFEALDEDDLSSIVIGPWFHGSWQRDAGAERGPLRFGSETSYHFLENIQAPFFAHHLKDAPDPNLPEALTFRTGSNAWQSHDAWPPKANIEPAALYFHPNGRLAFEPPPAPRPSAAQDGDPGHDVFVSDPARPVPYRARPIQPTYGSGSTWRTWQTEDQRFAHLRPDVVSWQTEPLEEDVTISGAITAHLFASTSGTDADWVVKLIDVYPDDAEPRGWRAGYQLMLTGEVFRARYRDGWESPSALRPNQVEEYVFGLHTHDHTFRAGHRIQVQVQSSWFPVIDRNPQTFVPNIFEARADQFGRATHRIHRSGAQTSHIAVALAR